ncbi:MAG: hypothetical protein ABJB11_06660 [Ferruginibacter sp.]
MKNILYSFLAVITLGIIILLISYPDKQGLGNFFSATIYYILTLFTALGLGVVAFLLRLLGIFRNKSNFFYTFVGVLNLSIGILALVLDLFNKATEPYFIKLFLLSLGVGLVIALDLFVNNKIQFKN